ncbi:hypothetical protein YC2023_049975 [Brassica napus]
MGESQQESEEGGKDVVGQVISLRDVQSVQVSGKDKKKVEFRLLDIKVSNDEFTLALTDAKKQKRLTKDHTVHWNNVEMKSISEIMMATVYSGVSKMSAVS